MSRSHARISEPRSDGQVAAKLGEDERRVQEHLIRPELDDRLTGEAQPASEPASRPPDVAPKIASELVELHDHNRQANRQSTHLLA